MFKKLGILAIITVCALLMVGLAVNGWSYYITKVYMAQGGDSLCVQSTGVINVALLDAINLASGSTFTNSNVTAGTSKASNMLILGATKNTDSLTTAYLKTTAFVIGSTAVTATGTELNYLDITTLGTGAASKAVVLDTGDDYTWPTTGIFTFGVLRDGPNATTITATGTEINKLAGVTAGTSKASSAAVLGATKNLDSLTVDYLKAAALLFGSRSLVLTKYRGKADAESVSVNIADLDADDMASAIVTGRAQGDSAFVVRAAIPGTGAIKLHFSKVPGDTIDISIQTWQD